MAIDWTTIDESPQVQAAIYALRTLQTIRTDIREYLDAKTIPIENIRLELHARKMPSGEFLTEEFERNTYGTLYPLHVSRNEESALWTFCRNAGAICSWRIVEENPGELPWLYITVSPSPGVPVDNVYRRGVTDWLNWLFPFFKGRIRVFFSTYVDATLTMRPGVAAFTVSPIIDLVRV